MFNISIDFDDIWDALSAIGTVGAVVVSLWIDLPSKFEFVCVKLQGIYEPMNIVTRFNIVRALDLVVSNRSDFAITINSITLR
ncbi:hypothetical protein LRP_1503 [Ligilactobacillus ruminis]|nr:hypothetical protein LRP_1503 [Ligilactobacillus ruminis]